MAKAKRRHVCALFFRHPTLGNIYVIEAHFDGMLKSKYRDILYDSRYVGMRRTMHGLDYNGMLTYRGDEYEELTEKFKKT